MQNAEVATKTDPEAGSKLKRLKERHAKLKSGRSSWDAHNRECAEYVMPRRIRMNGSETNQGTKKNDKIINSKATKALRTLGAGMFAGITHPARPWHVLGLPDPRLMAMPAVKAILQQIAERQRDVFNRSNFYNSLAQLYEDLALHGTSVMWIDDDLEDVIRCHVLVWGTYSLALDARGFASTLFRDVVMTVGQIKEKGWLFRASEGTKRLAREQRWDEAVNVVHVIEKRLDRDVTKVDNLNMPWASFWFEDTSDPDAKFLYESGYEECPFVAPRWHVVGNDTYGTGPTHDGLGDIKAIQDLEREKARASQMVTKPPMTGPAGLRTMPGGPNILPGGMTYNDAGANGQKFEPSVKVDPQTIKIYGEEIKNHEYRIDQIYFADLWLMLANSDRREITAREVDERHEEKMLQLGPVLVRLYDELLDPALDRVFAIMQRRHMFDDLWAEAPPEVQGSTIKVEYISILAQAQKLLASSGVERFVAMIGNIANVRPDILDVVDWDGIAQHYADILGVRPDLLLPKDVVQKIRAAKQAQNERMLQVQQQMAEAKTAKDLAGADTSGDNVLTRMAAEMGSGMAAA